MPNKEILAPRSRRRRRDPGTTRTATSTCSSGTEKENQATSTNKPQIAPSEPKPTKELGPRKVNHAAKDTPRARHRNNDSNKNKASNGQYSHPLNNSLKQFQAALSSTISANFWSEHSGLAECVVRASLSLGEDEVGKVHLHENAVALLQTCRGLIKEATEIKEDAGRKINHLVVAAHGLRAVGLIFSGEVTRQETAIKLLYHLVLTAAEIVKDDQVDMRAAVLSLAGYQALGQVLAHYACREGPNERLVGFQSVRDNDILAHAFAVPDTCMDGTVRGKMDLRQVSTIALKATFVIASVLRTLWCNSPKIQPTSDQFSYEFGDFVHNLTRHSLDRKHPPHHMMVRLIRTVALPWISLLLDSSEKECVEDAVAKCKTAHRLLWDAAAQLREANSSDSQGEIQKMSLELRGHAILVLLPCRNSSPEVKTLLAQKHFEMACTCARKAAATYVQLAKVESLPVKRSSALYSFYEQLATRLQAMVLLEALPFYYVEFCAHQALHIGACIGAESCGVADCCLVTLPSPMSSDGDNFDNNTCNRVALALFLLAIFVKGKIASFLAGEESPECFCSSNESLESHAEHIIESFRVVFIEEYEKLPYDALTKYLKLWTKLSLHRTLFRIQNEKTKLNGTRTEVVVASTLLSNCIGPLYHKFLSIGQLAKSELFQYYELMVECYIRSASSLGCLALDAGAPSTGKKRLFLGRSNKVIRDLQCVLLRNVKMVPQPILEKVAKALAVSARQRGEFFGPKECLLPLLCSLQLFLHLSDCDSSSATLTFQISSRWAHVASVFQSAGMMDEACMASAAALASHVPNSSQPERMVNDAGCPMHMMQFLASHSRRVLVTFDDSMPLSDQEKSLISKLVSLFSKRIHSNRNTTESKENAALPLQALAELLVSGSEEECLVGVELGDRFGIEPRLGEVLRAILLADVDSAREAGALHGRIIILAEVLVCLGTKIQRHTALDKDSSEDLILSSMLEDYIEVTDLVVSLMHRLSINYQEVLPSLMAALYIVGSAALLPFQNFYDETLRLTNGRSGLNRKVYDCARTLAEKGRKISEYLPDPKTEGRSLLVTVNTALSHMIVRLSRLQGENSSFENITGLLASFMQGPGVICSTKQADFSKRNFVWALMNFYNMLKLDGDVLRASVIADLVANLAMESNDYDWCGAVAITSCLSSNVISNAAIKLLPNFSSKLAIDRAGRSPFSNLAKVELFGCQVRLWLRVSNGFPVNVPNIVDRLLLEQTHLESEISGDALASDVLAIWVLSTIELATSELSESFGNIIGAIRHLQSCIQYCRKLSSVCRRCESTQLDIGHPFWVDLALSSLLTELSDRHLECNRRKAFLYGRLGRYRKAEGYAMSMTQALNGAATPSRPAPYDLMVSMMEAPTSREKIDLRMKLEIQAMSTSLDNVANGLCRWNRARSTSENDVERRNNFSNYLDYIQDLLSVGDVVYADAARRYFDIYTSYYEEAERKAREIVDKMSLSPYPSLPSALGSLCAPQGKQIESVLLQLKLRQVRCLMGESGIINAGMQGQARELCLEVVQSSLALAKCRAKALFYLGSMDLENARTKGALHSLWQGHSDSTEGDSFVLQIDDDRSGQKYISQARDNFLASASLLGSSTDVFSRNVMRCLALVNGPEPLQPISGMSSCTLILSSVGRMARQHILNSIAGSEFDASEEVLGSGIFEAFDAFDGNFNDVAERNRKVERFFSRFGKIVPTGWNFVSPVLCPTGDILVTSIYRDLDSLKARTACIFSPGKEGQAYNEILRPLDEIIQASQDHLQGSMSAVSEGVSEEESKRTWWQERENIDARLCGLIERVETSFFGSLVVKQIFFGDENSDSHSSPGSEDDSSSDLECGNLASKFEAACGQSDETRDFDGQAVHIEEERSTLEKLTVPKIKARLLELEVPISTMRKLRKKELIELLIQEKKDRHSAKLAASTGPPEEDPSSTDESRCIFLILDENLHRFPFEGMSLLEGRTVCRVPSLPFLFATILRQQHDDSYEAPKVDPSRVAYVLDPENNLRATRDRILPTIESLQTQNGWEWGGVIGSQPSVSFFEESLKQDNALMLYFGHGGGQSCFSRRHVEGMMGNDFFARHVSDNLSHIGACRATVILMGCSSGRLTAINRRHTDTLDELPLFYDPEGIALSYLCAGAPCVVGTLWDVTDRDIDRYSVAMLNRFFLAGSDGYSRDSLARCVSSERSACKLRYIVGCATVCYGVPIHLSRMCRRDDI